MRAYPEYKYSGIDYLSDMPSHWELWKFKRLTNILTCGYASTPQYISEEDGVAFLSAQNVKPARIILDKYSYISKELHRELTKNKKPKNGDVLIVRVGGEGNIGDAAIVNLDFEFSVYVSLAHVRTRENLINKFLIYFFQTDYAKLLSKIETQIGGGVGNLNVKDMERYKIPTPPYQEQQAIVNFLDYKTRLIDNFIANRQQQQKLLKEQKAGIINKAVTKGINPHANMKPSGIEWIGDIPENWQKLRLKNIAKRITNGFVGSTHDILQESGVRYIQALHVKQNAIIFNNPYYVSEDWSKKHPRSILKEGDIVITQTGAMTGDVGLISKEFDGCNCHALIIVKPDMRKVNPEYLLNILASNFGNGLLESIRTGSMHPHLNSTIVCDIYLPIPVNLKEQQAILNHIKTETALIDTLITKYQKQIELMQEYRTALISQAVTGKIDVRHWQPKNKA